MSFFWQPYGGAVDASAHCAASKFAVPWSLAVSDGVEDELGEVDAGRAALDVDVFRAGCAYFRPQGSFLL